MSRFYSILLTLNDSIDICSPINGIWVHFSAVSFIGNALKDEKYLTAPTLSRENAPKCTYSSSRCPCTQTISQSLTRLTSSRSFWRGKLYELEGSPVLFHLERTLLFLFKVDGTDFQKFLTLKLSRILFPGIKLQLLMTLIS